MASGHSSRSTSLLEMSRWMTSTEPFANEERSDQMGVKEHILSLESVNDLCRSTMGEIGFIFSRSSFDFLRGDWRKRARANGQLKIEFVCRSSSSYSQQTISGFLNCFFLSREIREDFSVFAFTHSHDGLEFPSNKVTMEAEYETLTDWFWQCRPCQRANVLKFK